MRMAWVFLNGEIVEETSARLSVNDRGLLLGDGLFETMRAYGGNVFRLGAHLARLRSSAEFLRLRFTHDDREIESSIAELIRLNECPNAYVRLTLTRGPAARGLRLDQDSAPTVLVHVRPINLYPQKLYRHGAKLIVSSIRQNSGSPLPAHKTLNYLPYLLARQEAADAHAHGAILLNECGRLAEESVSNVFLVRGDELLTPPVHCGLLPGITRAAVIELAEREEIKLRRRPVMGGEIFESDEMFLTNSLMEIMPVRSIDRRRLGRSVPGPITERLQGEFRKLVERETGVSVENPE